ncbi:hypothetical protein DL93DRAFT_2162312 [Clavulina sp. PMI_390]|nr:hypothetical protein DL93DRAFT_2162312 [Clavulina sp. PMI_390]
MAKAKAGSSSQGNASLLSFFSKTSGKKADKDDSGDETDADNVDTTPDEDALNDLTGVSDDEILPSKPKGAKTNASKPRAAGAATGNRTIQKSKDLPHLSDLPPISDIYEMFRDIAKRRPEIIAFAKQLNGRPLRVATMCSGTEAPLLALGQLARAIQEDHGVTLNIEHVFSCEIEPFKQGYIERNFRPPILFRDVCELGNDEATTAYGAKVPVPGNVDLLVAGTSCVDYSTLNNEKQDIDANGESGRTFRGMLSWVTKHRPKIVILENVCGAPWNRVVTKFEGVNYSAAHQRFDTRLYYIPHTRTRGYLVAIDRVGSDIPKRWVELVQKMARPASCTLDAFLLESDDPRIHSARQALVHEGATMERKAGYDWGRCESRHIKARHDEQLGNRRPLTSWEENGNAKMPDFAWNDWSSNQVDRVWDLMDITTLRSAALYEDPAYKTKIWNLSQNVDRQIGSSRVGVAPCFTPTMIPYLTNRGGPLVGAEALALQGIPVDELNFTRETQDQLADLAGNAMSSTVVGTAMVAALTLAAKLFPKGEADDDEMDVDQPSKTSAVSAAANTIRGVEDLQEGTIDLTATSNQSLPKLLSRARSSRRLCACEGRDDVLTRLIRQCVDCGFSACEKCGGRPEHNVEDMNFIDNPRLRPSDFRPLLKEQLPMSVSLDGISSSSLDTAIEAAGDPPQATTKWRKSVLKATTSPLHFKTDKRQEHWVVIYESPTARLELHLNPSRPEWILYARPDRDEPANSPLRTLLMRPVARLLCKSTLLAGTWEIAVPTKKSFPVTVEGTGELVPSWEMRLGLEAPELRQKKVWSSLKISYDEEYTPLLDHQIDGAYSYLDKCGTACSALHKRDGGDDPQNPLFFFLDPDRCGDPADDVFVFSSSIRRTEYGEARTIFAYLDSSWRPSSKKGPQESKCFIPAVWVPMNDVQLLPTANLVATFSTPETTLNIETAGTACEAATAVLVSKVPLSQEHLDAVWPVDQWGTVDSVHERITFQKISWVLERVRNFRTLNNWSEVACDHESAGCSRCAPKPPSIRWAKGKGKNNSIVAVEDAYEAGDYEYSLKHRPTPFVAQLKFDSSSSLGIVQLGINIPSLFHRAISLLPHDERDEKPTTSWRLTTGYVPPARLAPPKFKLPSNRKDAEADQPPNFKIPLRPEQLRSLTWMLSQESADAPPFLEEEVVEAIQPSLGWRVEARAQRPIRVSGGVLADEVGYGKTAITLGLLDATRHLRPKNLGAITPDGRLRSRATLVAVPAHLTRQWQSEATKFLGSKCNIIMLETMTNVNKLTVDAVLTADLVVIASNLLRSDAYLLRLAAFAGVGGWPNKDGRFFDAKLKQAHEGIKDQVRRLETEGAAAVFDVIKDAEDHPKSDFVQGSRRLKGKQYRDRVHEDTVLAAPARKLYNPAIKVEVVITTPPPKYPSFTKAQSSGKASKAGLATTGKRARPSVIVISDDEDGQDADRTTGVSDFDPSASEEDDFNESEGAPEVDSDGSVSDASSEPPRKMSKASSKAKAVKPRKRKTSDSDEEPEEEAAPAKKQKTKVGAKPVKPPKPAKVVEKQYVKDSWGFKSAAVRNDWKQMRCPPLELFHFERLVIDEYTYLEGRVYSLVTSLRSDHRWILSGTPPTEDFASVNTIAAFMGVHLGVRDDFWEGQSKESLSKAKKRQKDQTSVENFHSFREVRSLDWHAHRDEQAQYFLNSFVRQNLAEIEDIPFVDKISKIILPAAERAIYLELEHHLRALDMSVRKSSKKTDGDREKRMYESLGNSQSAEEALLKRCSHFELELRGGNALKSCELIVAERSKQLEACIEEARREFAKAMNDEKKIVPIDPHSHFREWCRMTHSDKGVGDADAKNILHQIQEDNGYVYRPDDRKKPSPDLDAEDKKKKEARWEHREHSHLLKKLEKELVARHRSLRYFKAVRDLQQGSEHFESVSCPLCDKTDLPLSDLAILSSCGHMGCHSCVLARAQDEECVCRQSEGCSAAARTLNVVKAETLGQDEERDSSVKHFGKKLESVVTLIKKCVAKDESVLLFVQFQDLMEKAAEALKYHKIDFLQIKGSNSARSSALAKFQDENTAEQVLLLNVGDESASGANLTNANHVIFLSPLLTPSQQFYTATEIQAIGRVRRYGQQKKVHIYRFLTLNSIDVEIFEARDPAKRKVDS